MTEDEARRILGVDPDATEDDIQSAYRRLAKEKDPHKLDRDDPLYEEKLEEWVGIGQARDILLGLITAGEPEPEPEQAAKPRPFVEPLVIDFGVVREDDDPEPVVIRLYNDGGEAEEIAASAPRGAWWQLDPLETNEATGEELSSGLLFKLVFVAPLAPRLRPGTHEGVHQISVDGVTVDIPVRLKIVTPSATPPGPRTSSPTPPPRRTTTTTPRTPTPTTVYGGARTKSTGWGRRFGLPNGLEPTCIAISVICTLTVLVPWLIGRYLLRDTWFFPTGEGVYNALRDGHGRDYANAEYPGGVAVIGFLLAAALLLRSWGGRGRYVVVGFVSLAIAINSAFVARSEWGDLEAGAVARAEESRQKVGSIPGTGCSRDEVTIEEDIWVALLTTESPSSGECDRLGVYKRGENFVAVSAPSQFNSYHISVLGLGSAEEPSVAVTLLAYDDSAEKVLYVIQASPPVKDAQLQRVDLPGVKSGWELHTQTSEMSVLMPGGIITVEQDRGSVDGRVIGIEASTGQVAWIAECPGDFVASPGSINGIEMKPRSGSIGCSRVRDDTGEIERRTYSYNSAGNMERTG
ncbi:DnaJ domain-containing protein [Streptomyces xinghaiensis]|uniref:DnaJ domain-containing protein n=1 Tax=Streptomyces xinghaiensis TaxID=1038928 RepID=UPI0037A6EE51